MKLVVMHCPPYFSKFNPIEHRLFAQIAHNWSGDPLMSIQDAAKKAITPTSKGLSVHVRINNNTYETKRTIDVSFQKKIERQVLFAGKLL